MQEQALLLVFGQHNPSSRTSPASVDYAMPGRVVRGGMHRVSDRASCVTFAENLRDLAVRHYATAGDAAHDFVDLFAIISFVFHAWSAAIDSA